MVAIPVGFNTIQFWILDEFLKGKPSKATINEGTSMFIAEDLQNYDDDMEFEKKKQHLLEEH